MCHSFVLPARQGKAHSFPLVLNTDSLNSPISRGTEYLKRGQLDQPLIYSRFVLKKAKVINYKPAICPAYGLEGTVLHRKQQFIEAMIRFRNLSPLSSKSRIPLFDPMHRSTNVYSYTGDCVKEGKGPQRDDILVAGIKC
jgi:hypothetical protein